MSIQSLASCKKTQKRRLVYFENALKKIIECYKIDLFFLLLICLTVKASIPENIKHLLLIVLHNTRNSKHRVTSGKPPVNNHCNINNMEGGGGACRL